MKKNLIAVIIGICVALLVSELILRLQNYQYVPLKIRVFEEASKNDMEDDYEWDEGDEEEVVVEQDNLGQTDCRPFHEKEDPGVIYSPGLIWRPKKNYKIFNAQGFRGRAVEKTKAPNEYRILAIGDSNTIGPPHSFGWVEYLGQLLEERLKNVYMINAGVSGYTSWQGFKRFEEMLKYKPDIVFVSFGANDAHRVAIPDKEYISSRRFFKIIHHLRLCQLLMHVIDVWALKENSKNPLVPRVNLSEYTDNLNAIINLAVKNKIKVVLLTRPYDLHEDDRAHSLSWIKFVAQYNELTREIAKNREIKLIDIYSNFKGKGEYFWPDDGHFNDEGHKIAAKLIYDHIIENLF